MRTSYYRCTFIPLSLHSFCSSYFSCSWRLWSTLSLMSYVTKTPVCQMAVFFPLSSTLSLTVIYYFLMPNDFYMLHPPPPNQEKISQCVFFFLVVAFGAIELKGVQAEMLVKLIPEHARKQCAFLNWWRYLVFLLSALCWRMSHWPVIYVEAICFFIPLSICSFHFFARKRFHFTYVFSFFFL